MRRTCASPFPRFRALRNGVSQYRIEAFRYTVTEVLPAFGIQCAAPRLFIDGNAEERAVRAGDWLQRDFVAPTVWRQLNALPHGERGVSAFRAEPLRVGHSLVSLNPTLARPRMIM